MSDPINPELPFDPPMTVEIHTQLPLLEQKVLEKLAEQTRISAKRLKLLNPHHQLVERREPVEVPPLKDRDDMRLFTEKTALYLLELKRAIIEAKPNTGDLLFEVMNLC